MLSFEAERVASVIDLAVLAANAIEEIPGIELDARLCSRHFEHPAGMRIISLRCRRERPGGSAIEHPIVIVAFSELQLLVILVDAGADEGGGGEVKRSSFDISQFPG